MKQFVLILLLITSVNLSAQTTAIPDANFEQELINLGLDVALDGQVLTANIDTVTILNVKSKNISDLTGIEDFIALTNLNCDSNQITNINVTQNSSLIFLRCAANQLTSLNVSQNTALEVLWCGFNQITIIDLSQNTALTYFDCRFNLLTGLDVSQNIALTDLYCRDNLLTEMDVTQNTALIDLSFYGNQLTCLNMKNGNNTNIVLFWANSNNLTCIEVDDVAYSTANWTNIDAGTSFSTNCNNICGPQHYSFPMSNTTWSVERYEWNYPFPDDCITRFYGYDSDTLINGIAYAKMYGNNLLIDYPYSDIAFNLPTAHYVAGVREDPTKKVWIRLPNDTFDILYYDFSLEVGDTFNFDYFPVGPQVVSLVDTVWIYGSFRRQIHFPVNSPAEIWIQGVGSNTGWFEWQYTASWYHQLRCFNNIPTFGTGCYCDTYILGVDELPSSAVTIYPNPTNGQITISLEETANPTITIRNALGQTVISQKFTSTNQIELDLDAPAGIYFLQLEVDDELITKKIIKQ